MNKKGGLLGNILVLIGVFLVGTFFGWTILGNVFGDDVEKLSPNGDLDQEEIISLCSGYKSQICDEAIIVEPEDEFELTSYNQTNSS